jgi:hypothetical protein
MDEMKQQNIHPHFYTEMNRIHANCNAFCYMVVMFEEELSK